MRPDLLARWAVTLWIAFALPALADQGMDRSQALQALTHADSLQRAVAVRRLGEVGTMADVERVAERLRDDDADVRRLATATLWQIWSHSGDAAIDRLLEQGVQQMEQGELRSALATFSEIVRRKPEFAEGWNKRATVLFLLGEDKASLNDCEEVLKRNPRHFGALSGMAQIHLRRGDPERALHAFERALQANPNLDHGAEFLILLREAVRRRGGRPA
ncbi:MAG: tetratricopeptide repeat protein [Burkholderiales bacterium]|nr:MAG: tetratricopeptide repeat protein [Burkholderiales bacterium]